MPTSWLTRWPLRYTLPLLLLVVAVTGGGVAYLYEQQLEQQRIRSDGLAQLRGFVSLQAQSLRAALVRGDLSAVRTQLASLALDPGIVHAQLVGSGNVVIASTDFAEIGRLSSPPSADEDMLRLHGDGNLLRASTALHGHVFGQGEPLGHFIVERDLAARLAASRQRLQRAFLRYFAYFCGVSLMLWALVDRVVWRRVHALGLAAERLAAGDVSARALVSGGDEIAAVARMVNDAAERLAASHATNARLTGALERIAAAAPGPGLFDELASAVAAGVGCRWAIIARTDGAPDEMRVVGAAGGAPWSRGVTYSLHGAPCAACLAAPHGMLVIESGLGAQYPALAAQHDTPLESFHGIAIEGPGGAWTGVLSLLGEQPRTDSPADRALLRTAADRIRQELARADDEAHLRERERELALARQLTSDAIESLDAGLLMLDADDRILQINTRYLDLYGLPRDRDYLGTPLRDIVHLHYELHPASRTGRTLDEAIEERMRLHRERSGHWEFALGDQWILVSDRPTADGGRVCLRTDITEMKRLQLALNERTELLELVVRGTADGLWSWDGDQGNDLYLAPRVYELLGYPPGGIEVRLDRFEATLYHPEDRPRIRALVAHMLAHPEEGDILSFEGRFLCGDGKYRWFHNRAALVRRADGSLRRFAGSISDIHERRLREVEVSQARQQLSDAIEAIDSGLMISDRDDRLVLSNRRYREMYEFTPELVRPGTHIADLARDLMHRHPEYRNGLPIEEAVQDRLSKHHARLGRWELELGGRWYQIGDFETGEGGVVSLRTDITHLKQIERELRERTEFLEAAVRGSMDGIYDIDLAADRAYFSPRFHELLGYGDGELPASWSAFTASHFHPEEADERARALVGIHAGESEFISREMRLRRRDGCWGWYHGRAAVVRNAEGTPYRLIGSLSDTQARHDREEELARARQQLQDAIESLDASIVMFDRDERFVLCNERFRARYGATALPLVPGVGLEACIRAHYDAHPERRDGRTLDEFVAERLDQYRNRRGSFEVLLGERWTLVSNYATADGGVVSLRTDITALKRTEAALRESEARLRTVFDNSPLGIFLAGTDGAVVFRNRVFAELTGSADVDPRRHAWLSHVHEEERAWIGARWYEYVSAATGAFDIEYRTAGAQEHVVRLRAAPVTEQGQVLGFAGTLEDVSAQRQAEIEQHRLQLQLQQAQKMDAIGHLTGGIAHDFNNILASILGYAALAGERRSTQEDPKLVTYLDAIRQSGERARELVAKMLAFSRSEPREVVTPTAVQPLVAEAVKLLKAIIPSSIHIVTVGEPGLPPVLVDGVDLHQAIVNLAVNARDAISGHGQITIAVRAPRQVRGQCASCRESFAERYVEIAVSDTGAGIAPEHLPRLFEPFFSTKEVGKGTGMGLAVTHGVVHRVGGHVLVDTTQGEGTTVRLLLRAAQRVVRAVPSAPATPPPTRTRAATVLVVDDEPLVMGLIAEVLEGQGYEVVGYTDSRQALAWARTPGARFELLVTDQTMPGLTGVELARELLAMRPLLPVVLCTGYSESVDARVAAAMGIRHFFSKPIPLERLVAAVDSLLSDGAVPAVVA